MSGEIDGNTTEIDGALAELERLRAAGHRIVLEGCAQGWACHVGVLRPAFGRRGLNGEKQVDWQTAHTGADLADVVHRTALGLRAVLSLRAVSGEAEPQ